MPVRLMIPKILEDEEEFLAEHELIGSWIDSFDIDRRRKRTIIVIGGLEGEEREFAKYMRGFGYTARVIKELGP